MAMVEDHGRKLRLGHWLFLPCLPVASEQPRQCLSLRGANPLSSPLIDPNFLGDARDVEDHGRRLQADAAAARRARAAGAADADLYTADVRSDDDIRAILRQRVDTVYHPVGTCQMGENDPCRWSIRN